MDEAVIIDCIRTPVGKAPRGSLRTARPDELAALVFRTLLDRYPQVDPDDIDDVILGDTNGAGEDNRNVARMAVLLAGLPPTVPGVTVNRLCASGGEAITQAARAAKIPVSICGEMAGEPEHVPILVGLGLDQLSMNAGSIPQVKRLIREVSREDCQDLLEEALKRHTLAEVEELVRDFLVAKAPLSAGMWGTKHASGMRS